MCGGSGGGGKDFTRDLTPRPPNLLARRASEGQTSVGPEVSGFPDLTPRPPLHDGEGVFNGETFRCVRKTVRTAHGFTNTPSGCTPPLHHGEGGGGEVSSPRPSLARRANNQERG